MKTRRSLSGESENTDINISPLIDMVFILLIFFIVTTVFVEEKGIAVDKPTAAGTSMLDKESIMFELTGSGQILFKGTPLTSEGVRATVRRLTQREQVPVIINVRRGAISNTVVRVIDQSRLGGAKIISLTQSN